MEILLYLLIFGFGLFVGFLVTLGFVRKNSYSGTILVTHNAGKIFYSLVLDDYPEKIEFKKKVIFKVEAPERSSDRK